MNDDPERRNRVGDVVRDLAGTLAGSAVAGLRSWLRWGLWGAAIGAVAAGGVGLYGFGLEGLMRGAAGGAVVGGGAALLLRLWLEAGSLS